MAISKNVEFCLLGSLIDFSGKKILRFHFGRYQNSNKGCTAIFEKFSKENRFFRFQVTSINIEKSITNAFAREKAWLLLLCMRSLQSKPLCVELIIIIWLCFLHLLHLNLAKGSDLEVNDLILYFFNVKCFLQDFSRHIIHFCSQGFDSSAHVP